MNNKIALTYENGEFNLTLNESIIKTGTDFDNAVYQFKQIIATTSSTSETKSWESIEKSILEYKDNGLEINNDYKTITFGPMKYFYTTGKVFYLSKGEMIGLRGGFDFFHFILTVASNGNIETCVSFIELCKEVVGSSGIYRITDSSITILSPRLNYGSAEYNFNSQKINKGASITQGTFEEFKSYILDIFKK
ncbi:hypothetical protein J1C67_12740 [Clostridium gasigenes]|uniref:hypothetical protein n=1 Tax=Clostridium gasigenes TaxID=94869 RepID=UPI0014386727|nr:hypothetical protein [Clostridium gasigenes]NKF08628.1 hypothetical protein [Clostridium gasigenes]QSW18415.1 hypothetical protein J1C67_12740 [Clostridium gasigenes]